MQAASQGAVRAVLLAPRCERPGVGADVWARVSFYQGVALGYCAGSFDLALAIEATFETCLVGLLLKHAW